MHIVTDETGQAWCIYPEDVLWELIWGRHPFLPPDIMIPRFMPLDMLGYNKGEPTESPQMPTLSNSDAVDEKRLQEALRVACWTFLAATYGP